MRVHDRQANRLGGPLPNETNFHCGQYEDDDWYNEVVLNRGKVMGKVVELDANELEVIASATPEAVQANRRCASVTRSLRPSTVSSLPLLVKR